MGNKNIPQKKPQGEVPAYVKQGSALGVDNFDMKDIVIPRLKIVQGQTRAKASNPKLIDGSFYHTVSEDILCPPGKVIILYFLLKWSGRIIFDEKLKFVASEYTDYNTKAKIAMGDPVDDQDPRWMDCINYFVLPQAELIQAIKTHVPPDPMIYTAMSASMGPAKKLNSHFKNAGKRGYSMCSHKVHCSASLEKFDKGNAFMPIFSPKGYASEKEYAAFVAMYNICKDLASSEAAQREEVKEDVVENPPPTATEPRPPAEGDDSFDFNSADE